MENKDLIVATNPKSSFAEAIKSAKTNIMFSCVDKDLKVITVTSPEPGDGKSFIIANLAVAFAGDGKKVLVIDGDLRRGRQHQIFNLGNSIPNGYSNLILNYRESTNTFQNDAVTILSQAIRPTAFKNVHLLPNGPVPPNPLELLSSENNAHVINKLREFYDIILIDCPPVLGLSDALILAKYSDVRLVTISSNKTKIDQLDEVKKSFEKVNSNISGVIINKAKHKGSNYYSYYTSKYYSDTDKND